MVRVARIVPGSIAEEVGLEPGAELVSVNGRALADFLDWEFLSADDELEIEARQSGESIIYEIAREDGQSLGIELEPPTVRQCANRCEFCFIEGLPPGLRKPLYLRDDDYRLSFAYGNFATLSNVRERDVARIFEYHLSPLYVSVHATPHEARKILLNNPKVPDIMAQLRMLALGGIEFHCQMVIVPGLNDGTVLQESLSDLWSLEGAVLSVAIVPVGLTQFSHLYTGRTMDRTTALGLLSCIAPWAQRAKRARGNPWVFGSDELYLLAGVEFPDADYYGEFDQVENGVGAVALLRRRVKEGAWTLARHDGRRIGVVTGTSMAPLMPELLEQLHATTGATFELIPVENSLFGPTTTTAGLLVGADIRRALEGRVDLDEALIPAETINDRGVFLDDVTFEAIQAEMPMPVRASYDFLDAL